MSIAERLSNTNHVYLLVTTDSGRNWFIGQRVGETEGEIKIDILFATDSSKQSIMLTRGSPVGKIRIDRELDCIPEMTKTNGN